MARTSTRDLTPILRATDVDLTPPLPQIEDDVRMTYQVLDLDRHSALVPHPHAAASGAIAGFPFAPPPLPVAAVRLTPGPRGARVTFIKAQSVDLVLIHMTDRRIGTFTPPAVNISISSWGGAFQSTFENGFFDLADALDTTFTVSAGETFTEGKDSPLPVYPGEFLYLSAPLTAILFFVLVWDEPV